MPVLRTAPTPPPKVTLPSPGAGVLPRQRLWQRLTQADALWVGAPAAAGKTVLAASCLQAETGAVLWYQVDSEDDDHAACFHYLARAAAAQAGERRARSLPRPGRDVGALLDDFARAWFRALWQLMPAPLTLVFDDWHRLPAAHPLPRVLPALLDERPAGRRLWIISRQAPPPVLDTARVSGRLHTLGMADLALTADETQALVAHRLPQPTPALAERWHRWCDGWVGALVFALAAGRGDPGHDPADADMAPVLGALASEVVDQADRALRGFMLATAWAPSFTAALARQLVPDVDVQAPLAQLLRRQLLITVHSGRHPRWRYHHLLREALLERARAQGGVDCERTAAALEADGAADAAAELLVEHGHTRALAAQLLRHAPQLLEQGRFDTVCRWAEALPDAERSPWVRHWWAAATMPRDVRQGQRLHVRAWQAFWDAGDADGLYRSWCGVIEGATFACDDYGDLAAWLQRLREMRQRFGHAPSLRVRAQVMVHAFSAGFLLHPRPAEFGRWLRGVQRLYQLVPLRSERAAIGALLGLHLAANGGAGALGAHLQGLAPLLDDEAVSPFHRLVGGVVDVIGHWLAADTDRALQRLQACERLATATGAHAMDTQLTIQSVYVHALRGDLAAADRQLHWVAQRLPELGLLDGAHHRFQLGWRTALDGRLDQACALLDQAIAETRQHRFALLEVVSRALQAELLALQGDADAARHQAAQAQALAQQMDSITAQVPCAMQAAAVATCNGDADADSRVAQAFALARRHGHRAWGGLFPPTLARLCLRALQQGVEPAFARELVQRHRLAPPPQALGRADGAAWPWPLRVQALGRLQLLGADGALATGPASAAQRPLDLLRALLSQLPRPLPVATALQWIWPDSTTTDQRKAFDVALLRARRLLGDDGLLRLEGGLLAFDEQRVWTDVGALLALTEQVSAAPRPAAAQAAEWSRALLQLASGPLLAESTAPWVQAARERLRRRLAAAAVQLAGWLDGEGGDATRTLAGAVLQRAFDHDPASEALASALAQRLQQAGDRREAGRVLRLCLHTRELHDEPPPSPALRAQLAALASPG